MDGNRLEKFFFLLIGSFVLLFSNISHAQGYIDCATIINDNESFSNGNVEAKVVNGYTYLLASPYYVEPTDARFPIINGEPSAQVGFTGEIYFAIFDPNCNQIKGTYISGIESSGAIYGGDLMIDDAGNALVVGLMYGTSSILTTDGTTIEEWADPYILHKYAPDGTLLYSTVYGGTTSIYDAIVSTDGTDTYVTGFVSSSDFPTTDGTTNADGGQYLVKYDSSGNLVYATLLAEGDPEAIVISNGCVIVMGNTSSTDFSTTDGTTFTGGSDFYIAKYDPLGNLVFSTIYGGSGTDIFFRANHIETDGTHIYVSGETGSADFPTTDGTVSSGSGDVYVRKYDMAGNLIFSTLLGGTGRDTPFDFVLEGGELYISGAYGSGDFPVTVGDISSSNKGSFLVKMDTDGNIIYARTYGTYTFREINGIFVDASGSVIVPLVGSTDVVSTDNEKSSEGLYVAKINPDGTMCSSTFINNSSSGYNYTTYPEMIGDTLYFLNSTYGAGNTTDGTNHTDNEDFVLTKFVFCPTPSPIAVDTLSTTLVMVCENGIIDKIDGMEQSIDGSQFPQIFDDGVATTQSDIPLAYQWQASPTGSDPWTDIPGPLAQQKDYTPAPTTTDLYYRRQTMTAECCGGAIVSTSNVAHIQVSTDVAPMVEGGDVSYTCPGSPVMIDATILGGTSPFIYDWNGGEFNVEDPVVSPTQSTVYTLEVIDANGCMQSGQTTVVTYVADAGIARDVCAGAGTTIGGTPLPGVTIVPAGGTPPAGEHSIEYTWSPAAGLSCSDCPNPIANPMASETYTLTVAINYPDGGSCQTTDMVEVGVIESPIDPEFAGRDTVLCFGETTVLGLAPDGGGGPYLAQAAGSSTTSGTLNISELSDGSTSTGVKTDDGNTQNVVLNLGSIFTANIINLAILNSSSFDSDFKIEVSTDGVNYTTLFNDVRISSFAQTTVSQLSPTTLSFPEQDVQYFRFTSESNFRDVGIGEFSAGFQNYSYIWTPGLYIATAGSYATYDAGTLEMPRTNPITYTVTANKGTCNFYDQVTVAVIEARAGEDGCGPRYLGKRDRTPDIEETYSWVKITDPSITTGTGDFLTATDILHTSVSASEGGDVGYELTVSYTLPSGVTGICKDTVIVPLCIGPGCDVVIEGGGCPDFDNGAPVLTGLPPNGDTPDLWTYSWDSDLGMTGLDSYTTQSVMLTDNVTRTYTVTFTSVLDPTETCSDTIVANSPVYSTPIINATGGTTCKGDTVNIGDPSNNPGLTYAWDNEEFLDDPTNNYPKAFPTATTDFILTATDNVTGCVVMDTLTVIVPTAANAGQDLNVCDNGVVTLGANTDILGYTYSWEPAGAAWEPGSGPTDAMPEVFVATTQDFYLTMVDTAGMCTTLDTVTVTVEALPPPFTLPTIDFCPSQTSLTLGTADGTAGGTNEVPDGYLYIWKPNTVSNEFAQNPTINAPLPTVSTTYTVTAATPGGCNQKTTQTINPVITPPVIASNSTLCLGESTLIGDDTNDAGFDYAWTSSDTDVSSTLDDATSLNPTFTPDATGTFIFTLTKSSIPLSCSSTAQVKITVTELNAPVLTPHTICEGETVQIGVSNDGSLQYQWNPTTDLDDPYISNPTFSGSVSTNYILTIIDDNGCTAEGSTSVTVNPAPAAMISLSDTTICDLNATSLVINPEITPAGSYAYNWSPTTFLDNPNILTPTFFIPGEGDYEYTLNVIDQTTGCSLSETTIMNVAYAVNPSLAALTDETICEGENFTESNVTTSVLNDIEVTYQWYDNNGTDNAGTAAISGQTTAVLTALPTTVGTYSYRVEAVNSSDGVCTAEQTVNLVINSVPIATAMATDATCNTSNSTSNNDGSIALAGFSSTDTYLYSPGMTFEAGNSMPAAATTIPANGIIVNNLANPSVSQDYTVRIFNNSGCFVDRVVSLNEVDCTPSIDYPDYSSSIRSCDDEPCHTISDELYLGQSVSAEENPTIGEMADSDDDDGVSIGVEMQFIPGNTVRIPVTVYNNTSIPAHLRMWIDWNADGDFEDAGEQIEDNTYPSTGAENIVFVSVTVPLDAIQTSAVALRARLSTDDTNSATSCGNGNCAADGEIEDYLIQINCQAKICPPLQLTKKSGNP